MFIKCLGTLALIYATEGLQLPLSSLNNDVYVHNYGSPVESALYEGGKGLNSYY